MITRRQLLAGGGAIFVLAGCGGPTGPGTLTVNAESTSDANMVDGAARPVTVWVVQLTSPAVFDTADAFALQDPVAALGGTLLQADRIVLAPGASASMMIGLEQKAEVIGVIANYRDPGKTFRAKTAAPAEGDATLTVSVGPDAIALQPA